VYFTIVQLQYRTFVQHVNKKIYKFKFFFGHPSAILCSHFLHHIDKRPRKRQIDHIHPIFPATIPTAGKSSMLVVI
jgi:hypothetical protein